MKKRILSIALCMLVVFGEPAVSFADSTKADTVENTVTAELAADAGVDAEEIRNSEITAAAVEADTTVAEDMETTGLNVAGRSVEEIRAFAEENPANLSQESTYAEAPSLSEPYSAGVLSDETQQSALNLINQCRYIAGLDANVALDSGYSEAVSAATFLNCLNGGLSHYPARPSELTDSKYDDLYNLGYSAASSSNIAAGYSNLNMAILNGWMSDSDASNIDRVGHRRWVLNPSMSRIGFGMTENSSSVYKRFYAMYAHDRNGTGTQTRVAWPAQNMPFQYFSAGDAWSVSFGKALTAADITVTLVRDSDNEEWNFSSSSSDGDFYVNNDGYGQSGCIIFRPENLTSIVAGDSFHVTITGAESLPVSYQVNFFDLDRESKTGSCGDQITWNYAGGVLKLSGSGKMEDYSNSSEVPWAAYADNIGRVSIGEGITDIGNYAFADCNKLVEVNLPSSLTEIGTGAFMYCVSLQKITLPDKLEVISSRAFFSCRALKEISVPYTVTSIGSQVFSYCSGMEKLYIYAQMPQMSSIALSPSSGNTADMYCYKNSYTEGFLKYNGYTCQYIDEFENVKNLTVNAVGYRGAYDGQKHSISVSVQGLEEGSWKVYYSLYENIYEAADSDSSATLNRPSVISPEKSEVGTTTVYYYVCADGYAIYKGSADIIIEEPETVYTDIAGCTVNLSRDTYTYDGTAQKPDVTVKDGSVVLSEGTDYTVTYSDNINAGTATLTVTGQGSYTGTVTKNFTISKAAQTITASISSGSILVGETAQITARVTKGNGALSYSSNNTGAASVNSSGLVTGKAAGTAVITVTAAETENYEQTTETLSVTVAKINLSRCTIALSQTSVTYDGTAQKPDVTVKYGSKVLNDGTDYTVSYTNNINAGTATLTVTGQGSYTGEVTKTFTIAKAVQTITASISSGSIVAGKTAQITAKVTKGNGKISYSSGNTDAASVDSSGLVTGKAAGTAVITVTAAETANYKAASKTLTVTVNPKAPSVSSLTNVSTGITVKWEKINGASGYYVYRKAGTETGWTKMKTVTSGSTVSWTDMEATGSGTKYVYCIKAYQTVSGKTYTSAAGSSKTIYHLSRPSVSVSNASSGITVKWGKVSGASGYYVYRKAGTETGWTKMKTVTSGSTVSWTDTKATSNGTKYVYTVKAYKTVSGTTCNSSYISGKTIYRLSRPTISGLTNSASKTFKVTWGKNTKASGYQVQYATASSFSGAKTKTYSGYSSVTKSVNGLTKGKTYYVRVRSYKTVGNVKYYSAWSAVKTVKIRK